MGSNCDLILFFMDVPAIGAGRSRTCRKSPLALFRQRLKSQNDGDLIRFALLYRPRYPDFFADMLYGKLIAYVGVGDFVSLPVAVNDWANLLDFNGIRFSG
jgi:hypothetical protein